MLAYAANRPVVGRAPSSPAAMLLIISAHVALIAAVMSAKMEFQPRHPPAPPLIHIPIPPPPPPPGAANRVQHPQPRPISDPNPTMPLPHPQPVPLGPGPTVDPGPVLGSGGASSIPQFPFQPIAVRHDPRLLTPADELKPPYPEAKLLSEEEATLRLRLTIDETGRVTAVEPIGAADRVFLDAARRYLIAHWRYQPATEDGRPVASSVVINLRFQLNA